MTTSEPQADTLPPSTIKSLRYARWAGYFLGALLFVIGLGSLSGGSSTFEIFKGGYFILYALVLIVPFARLSDVQWRALYVALTVFSALFVFIMIAVVMFAYMAAADRGERLGVPGFEGTLIFLALLQVPVVLFQRKPDLLT